MNDAATFPQRGQFASELKRRRKRLGMSCAEAARRAGYSPSTWTQVESGAASRKGRLDPYPPSQAFILRAAPVVGWPLDEAFAAAGMGFNPDDLPPLDDAQLPEDAEFLQLLGPMLPTQRKVLFGLMRTMHDPHTDVEKLLKAS